MSILTVFYYLALKPALKLSPVFISFYYFSLFQQFIDCVLFLENLYLQFIIKNDEQFAEGFLSLGYGILMDICDVLVSCSNSVCSQSGWVRNGDLISSRQVR